MKRQRKADLLLVLVTGFWGVSYFLSNLCLTDMGPLTLNAFRFVVAFVLLFILLFPKMRHVSRATLKYAFFVGLCLSVAYIGATCGLQYTSISNAGFICAMPVVFTPLFGFLFKRQIPSGKMAVALVICIIGAGLLTLNERFQPSKGDLICLLCAIGYAADLQVTETAVRQDGVNALQLGVYQLGTVAVVMTVLAFLFEDVHLPTTPTTWGAALFLGVFCSGVAFVVTTVQQQFTSASHVGLIFTLEPLFSAIVAFLFAHERLSVQGYIGAALMMSALVFMEGDFKGLRAKLRRKRPDQNG